MLNTQGKHGRLKYDTRARAQRAADKLGLDGTHSHQMSGTTIYMPGRRHEPLNKALRDRGMRPTPVPGEDGMMGGGMSGMSGGMGGGMSSGMSMGSNSEPMSMSSDMALDADPMDMDAVVSSEGRGGDGAAELDPMMADRDDPMDLPDPGVPAGRTQADDDVLDMSGGMMDMRGDVLEDQTDRAMETDLFGDGVGRRSEGDSRNVLVGDPDDDDEMELY